MYERLEQRRLMSITPSLDAAGVLTVQGSSGDDSVEVVTGGGTVTVLDGSELANGGDMISYIFGNVDSIVIDTGAGYDSVTLSAMDHTDVAVHTGDDGDRVMLTTSSGHVQVFTGDGDDGVAIWDEGANGSQVELGAGNDFAKVMVGSSLFFSPTIVRGGDGDDVLIGSGDYAMDPDGNEYFDAGYGFATLFGGAGNDVFAGYNIQTVIDGGEGEDDAVLAYVSGMIIRDVELTL